MYAMQFISGKANVVRRQFYLAHLLLGEALLYAQEIFGKHHLRYADCLMGKFNLDFIGVFLGCAQLQVSTVADFIRERLLD